MNELLKRSRKTTRRVRCGGCRVLELPAHLTDGECVSCQHQGELTLSEPGEAIRWWLHEVDASTATSISTLGGERA